jgi:hypothetical protein
VEASKVPQNKHKPTRAPNKEEEKRRNPKQTDEGRVGQSARALTQNCTEKMDQTHKTPSFKPQKYRPAAPASAAKSGARSRGPGRHFKKQLAPA